MKLIFILIWISFLLKEITKIYEPQVPQKLHPPLLKLSIHSCFGYLYIRQQGSSVYHNQNKTNWNEINSLSSFQSKGSSYLYTQEYQFQILKNSICTQTAIIILNKIIKIVFLWIVVRVVASRKRKYPWQLDVHL